MEDDRFEKGFKKTLKTAKEVAKKWELITNLMVYKDRDIMRLVGLATLSIEKDISNKLDMEEIIQKFIALKARKIKIV